jgi:hypothetical protein
MEIAARLSTTEHSCPIAGFSDLSQTIRAVFP